MFIELIAEVCLFYQRISQLALVISEDKASHDERSIPFQTWDIDLKQRSIQGCWVSVELICVCIKLAKNFEFFKTVCWLKDNWHIHKRFAIIWTIHEKVIEMSFSSCSHHIFSLLVLTLIVFLWDDWVPSAFWRMNSRDCSQIKSMNWKELVW